MVPHQTLHLTTEPPGSVVAVWTTAVIQDCCPGMTKMFALRLILRNKNLSYSYNNVQCYSKTTFHLLVV